MVHGAIQPPDDAAECPVDKRGPARRRRSSARPLFPERSEPAQVLQRRAPQRGNTEERRSAHGDELHLAPVCARVRWACADFLSLHVCCSCASSSAAMRSSAVLCVAVALALLALSVSPVDAQRCIRGRVRAFVETGSAGFLALAAKQRSGIECSWDEETQCCCQPTRWLEDDGPKFNFLCTQCTREQCKSGTCGRCPLTAESLTICPLAQEGTVSIGNVTQVSELMSRDRMKKDWKDAEKRGKDLIEGRRGSAGKKALELIRERTRDSIKGRNGAGAGGVVTRNDMELCRKKTMQYDDDEFVDALKRCLDNLAEKQDKRFVTEDELEKGMATLDCQRDEDTPPYLRSIISTLGPKYPGAACSTLIKKAQREWNKRPHLNAPPAAAAAAATPAGSRVSAVAPSRGRAPAPVRARAPARGRAPAPAPAAAPVAAARGRSSASLAPAPVSAPVVGSPKSKSKSKDKKRKH